MSYESFTVLYLMRQSPKPKTSKSPFLGAFGCVNIFYFSLLSALATRGVVAASAVTTDLILLLYLSVRVENETSSIIPRISVEAGKRNKFNESKNQH